MRSDWCYECSGWQSSLGPELGLFALIMCFAGLFAGVTVLTLAKADGYKKLSAAQKRLLTPIGVGLTVTFIGSFFMFSATVPPRPYEAIEVSNARIWVAPNGTASVAGMVVHNTGNQVVSIGKIVLKGMSVPTNSWYYYNDSSVAMLSNLQRELIYDDTLDTVEVTGEGSPELFTRAGGPLSLQPGQMIFLYLANPARIDAADIDQTFRLNVHAGKAGARVPVSVTRG